MDLIVTEQGLADLRGLAPRERAKVIIENCVHPDYKDLLGDYYRAAAHSVGGQTPHLLDQAFAMHLAYRDQGDMRKTRYLKAAAE